MVKKKRSPAPMPATEELATGLDPRRHPKLAEASQRFEIAKSEFERARRERERWSKRLARLRADIAAGVASPFQLRAAEPQAQTAEQAVEASKERAVRAALRLKSAASAARKKLAKEAGPRPAAH